MRPVWPTAISTEPLCAQPTPSSATGARRERRHPEGVTVAQKRATALDPLENSIGRERPAGCAKILLDFCGYREATRYACLRCELLVLSFIALVAQNGETSTVRYIAMQNFIGVWKLVEARAFDDDGHEVPSPMGPEPMGGLFVEAERIMVIAGDGRTTLPPDGPKRAFVAYSGPYTLDGTRYVCHVDSGSSPEMFIDQIRHVRFESPTRIVVHPLSRLLDRAAGLEFVFERVG